MIINVSKQEYDIDFSLHIKRWNLRVYYFKYVCDTWQRVLMVSVHRTDLGK